jgi:hypothetical protein
VSDFEGVSGLMKLDGKEIFQRSFWGQMCAKSCGQLGGSGGCHGRDKQDNLTEIKMNCVLIPNCGFTGGKSSSISVYGWCENVIHRSLRSDKRDFFRLRKPGSKRWEAERLTNTLPSR